MGYEAEEHEVTTEDGFILTIHRILSGPKSLPTSGKPIVILMHGLLAASDVWVSRRDCQDLGKHNQQFIFKKEKKIILFLIVINFLNVE